MFSSLGREKFTIEDAKSQPGLIETLKTAGFHMLWRNNNSGCKDVCNAIPNETVGPPRKQFYDGNLPTDDVLLEGLDPWLDAIDRPSVLWLHMRGSHGPAYFRRYPPEFERFKPTCQDTRFSKCTVESVVNAYDNTILYTDHVLAELIARLKSRAPTLSTAIVYVSDHGELLGENNMYLHGAPYAFAPDTQKHVPMVVWSSPSFARETALDVACLASKRAAPTSHDNLYHSILGLMDTTTPTYDRSKDIFAPCRRGT